MRSNVSCSEMSFVWCSRWRTRTRIQQRSKTRWYCSWNVASSVSVVAWLVHVSLPQTLCFLMTGYSSSFRSTSPEYSSPRHLTAPLMILNSIRLMGPQRKVRSAALQRKTRPIAKSLFSASVLYQSEFWNLGSPRLLITRSPPKQCFQHSKSLL